MPTRSSTTDLAVLGALSVEPMSGYELRRAIHEVLGHFWSESFGQIYPALHRLRDEGLIEAQPGDRPGSSVFSINDAGRTRLTELLQGEIRDRPPRNGLLLRLFFGRNLGAERCLALLDETEASTRAQLAQLRATQAEVEREASPDGPYFLLTIDLGIRTCEATLDWVEASRATLTVLDGGDGSSSPAAAASP
jgi:DNA-binding PadR family transcriptional regulator